MQEIGTFNPHHTIAASGLRNIGKVYYNLTPAQLYEQAIKRNEAQISAAGALSAKTGQHTGRSAQDKFIVRTDETADRIWWDSNKPMEQKHFDALWENLLSFAQGRDLFVQDLIGGAEHDCALKVRVITENAWHALFIRNLLIRPSEAELAHFTPELTILHMPSFEADPARHHTRSSTVIACDFPHNKVLIGGTSYAGEIKKSVFTVLNYLLPAKGIMPMHCSANKNEQNETAIFFGLSGTGKTTLSAASDRILIGDDEHGWSDKGVFNFEGGCYAKTIHLSPKAEPQIYGAAQHFGTVLENVVLDKNHEPDFDDGSLTENARCAYPIDFIANADPKGTGGQPKNIIMLTADAFGVLPPIAKLTPAEAMYHFLSGYTAKIAGTEKGVTEPQATFSACFGAPFMPLHPTAYSALLGERIAAHKVDCWLVNTGWTGGAYGVGKRMPIATTRALLSAALSGKLSSDAVQYRKDEYFGFAVPQAVEGVDSKLLNPVSTWTDKQAFAEQAARLVAMFTKNFETFTAHVSEEVKSAAPRRR